MQLCSGTTRAGLPCRNSGTYDGRCRHHREGPIASSSRDQRVDRKSVTEPGTPKIRAGNLQAEMLRKMTAEKPTRNTGSNASSPGNPADAFQTSPPTPSIGNLPDAPPPSPPPHSPPSESDSDSDTLFVPMNRRRRGNMKCTAPQSHKSEADCFIKKQPAEDPRIKMGTAINELETLFARCILSKNTGEDDLHVALLDIQRRATVRSMWEFGEALALAMGKEKRVRG
ncbi:hypothetical protein BKA81DRAFT_401862 [Phyllosticta paracitricarpa]|uniref:Uncharacterized protein n=1 Tax=Phyllosticta paracitricarpa TaxID=2016321 RepID=A0ABR1MY08_9PEZI